MQLIYVLMELPTTREKYAFGNTHQLKIRFHGAVFLTTYSQNSQLHAWGRWCRERDMNPYALLRGILSPLRLPIPPPRDLYKQDSIHSQKHSLNKIIAVGVFKWLR